MIITSLPRVLECTYVAGCWQASGQAAAAAAAATFADDPPKLTYVPAPRVTDIISAAVHSSRRPPQQLELGLSLNLVTVAT